MPLNSPIVSKVESPSNFPHFQGLLVPSISKFFAKFFPSYLSLLSIKYFQIWSQGGGACLVVEVERNAPLHFPSFTPLYLYSSCSSSHTKLGIAHCLSPNALSPFYILGQTTLDQFVCVPLFLYCCKHVRLFAQHVLSSPHVCFHHFHFLTELHAFLLLSFCHTSHISVEITSHFLLYQKYTSFLIWLLDSSFIYYTSPTWVIHCPSSLKRCEQVHAMLVTCLHG